MDVYHRCSIEIPPPSQVCTQIFELAIFEDKPPVDTSEFHVFSISARESPEWLYGADFCFDISHRIHEGYIFTWHAVDVHGSKYTSPMILWVRKTYLFGYMAGFLQQRYVILFSSSGNITCFAIKFGRCQLVACIVWRIRSFSTGTSSQKWRECCSWVAKYKRWEMWNDISAECDTGKTLSS